MIREVLMKITLQQRENEELEVIIRYPELTQQVKGIVRYLRTNDACIVVKEGMERKFINVHEIYYVESLERKTFVYTKDQVYRAEKKLTQLQKELAIYDFVLVSRTCLLNLNHLKSVETISNSRLEGTLRNGEKISISRTYAYQIKRYFEGGH